MAEKRIVVDHLKLSYEGLFDAQELYLLIDSWLNEKGFDKRELRNQEHVREGSKYIELELLPWKKITEYAKHEIRIEIKMFGVKEVEIEREGHKVRMNKGRINMVFDGWLITDYENRWEQRPMYYFLRTLFDKFVYRSYTSQYESLLAESVQQLHTTIKSFLNLYKY